MKNAILASTSTLYGEKYLDYLLAPSTVLFEKCSTILFIPFARPSGISHEAYTEKVALTFAKIGKKVKGLHEFENYQEAIANAEAIFTGGGNTFLLVSQLYKTQTMSVLTEVIKNGTPFLGTSAGSNICGLSMQTTNDMPIIHPPSFKTLGIISFNLNPHYIDINVHSQHMGETREDRIQEFHAFNTIPVLGLREGSWLEVKGETVVLKGKLTARLFKANENAVEIESGTDLGFLK